MPKTYLWQLTDGIYRTFDDFTLKTPSEATWTIRNEELFEKRLGGINWADGRLGEIIPPDRLYYNKESYPFIPFGKVSGTYRGYEWWHVNGMSKNEAREKYKRID